MANNQYVNKVVFGNQTLLDLTDDTVEASKLISGYTAHDATGAPIIGTAQEGGYEIIVTAPVGSSIAVIQGQMSFSDTVGQSGECTFIVPTTGNWVITATLSGQTSTQTITVEDTEVELSYFNSYITVVTPRGATVTCAKDGVSYSSDYNTPYTFVVHSSGTWVLTCTHANGAVETRDVVISSSDQSISFNLNVVTNTFAGVQDLLDRHIESYFLKVGDEFGPVTIGSYSYTFVIADINLNTSHEVLFISKYVLESMAHHSSNVTTNGWLDSDIRTYLNGTFKNNLPSAIKNNVKPYTFKVAITSSTLSDATDYVWLPRECDVFNDNSNEGSRYSYSIERQQAIRRYKYFDDRGHKLATPPTYFAYGELWWLSSINSNTKFCNVSDSGVANTSNASYSRYLRPCFRFLANN